MNHFLPTTEMTGQRLTEAIWALALPPAYRQKNDTVQAFTLLDALDGSCWLNVPDEFAINVHAEADFGEIADILQPFIDDGSVPADTNVQLAALVESLRGKRLVVWDAFPQFFKDQSKDMKGMIEASLLAKPSAIP